MTEGQGETDVRLQILHVPVSVDVTGPTEEHASGAERPLVLPMAESKPSPLDHVDLKPVGCLFFGLFLRSTVWMVEPCQRGDRALADGLPAKQGVLRGHSA